MAPSSVFAPSFRSMKRRLVPVVAAVSLASLVVLLAPLQVEPADAASAKITMCHRTHSTTNPYRRITVSQNAVQNSRHGGHKVTNGNPAVFDAGFAYAPANKIWGDIIPGATDGGTAYNGSNAIALNWTAAGVAAFAAHCAPMTAKQFYDHEIAAGQTPESVIADLNDMAANEDAALLASIGGAFTVGNVGSWDAAVSVSTSPATSVASTTATLNGSVTVGAISTAIGFDWGTSATLATYASVSAGAAVSSVTGRATTYALTGLTGGTTYYFRATGTTNAGTDTEGVLAGAIRSFTTTGSAAQSITFDQPAGMALGAGTQALTSATANVSGLAVTFTSTTTSVCTVAGAVVTAVDAGTCSITASQAGDATYAAAPSVVRTFAVTATSRTLSIDAASYAAGGYAVDAAAPVIAATASAGDGQGTKSYSSTTPSVCTVTAATGAVAFVAAGTCTIGADITAAGAYGSATAVAVSFPVTAAARTLAIDAASYAAGGYAFDASPPTITSSASAGAGTKSYSSTTPSVCTVDAASGLVTFVAPGTCTIGASIAAAGAYGGATATPVSFPVAAVVRTLAIDASSYAAGGYVLSSAAPTITSTPSAGAGTKSYASSTPSVCTVDGASGLVSFVAAGACTIGASISAAGPHGAATATSVSFPLSTPAAPVPTTTTTTAPVAPAPVPVRTTPPTTLAPTTTTTAPTPAPTTTVPPAIVPSPLDSTPVGVVEGVVWFDRNANGAFDEREWVLPGVRVVLRPAGFSASAAVPATTTFTSTAVTDASGRYRVESLPPGDYVVAAAAEVEGFDYTSDSDGGLDWHVTATVAAGTPGVASFAGLGKGRIVGQMFEESTLVGLADATIRCTWGGFDDVLGTADDVPFELTADAEGRFDLQGVPYGNFTCGGTGADGRRSRSVAAAVFSPVPQRAALPVGSTVPTLPVTGADAAGLASLAVVLVLVGALLSFGSRRRPRATPGARR